MILVLFTFYWNKNEYENKKMIKWVRLANLAHFTFILYTTSWVISAVYF